MKKLMIYLTAILMVMFSVTLKAQDKHSTALNSVKSIKKSETKAERKEVRKEERNLVSDLSMDAFVGDFGEIPNVVWEKGPDFDEALFTRDGIKYKAYYDINSKLVGTTTNKTFADLPQNAQKEIKKHYNGYHVDKVVYFEDNETNEQDMLLYGTRFEDADNYFVELTNHDKNRCFILQVNPEGDIFFFTELQKEI